MSNHEERLDRYIDDLNAGKANGAAANDSELAALFETVGQLHTLRESNIPAALAAGLSKQLQRPNVAAPLNSHPERSAAQSNGSLTLSAMPWTGSVDNAQDDARDAHPRPKHWLRQVAQFAGAALAFTLFGLVLVLVFGGTEGGDLQPAAAPPLVGQIAFTGSDGGNEDIYLINADGSGLVNLTQHPASDMVPSWSPDGSQIAFVSTRDGQAEIYTINADGSNVRRLTDNAAPDGGPVWSLDGQHIAFVRETGDVKAAYTVYVMNADGSDQHALTSGAQITSSVAWSPDSTRLSVPGMSADENYNIQIVDVTTREVRSLVSVNRPHMWVSWSPDGERLVATTHSGAGWPRISTMNVDGLDARTPSMAPEMQSFPDWSPRGREFLFVGQERGVQGIFVANMDDASTRLVTTTDGVRYLWPVWSSDARQVAFVQTESSNNEVQDIHQLMTVNADGSGLTSLTSDLVTGSFALPAWRPTGSSMPADEESTPIPTAMVSASPKEDFETLYASNSTVVPKETSISPDSGSGPELLTVEEGIEIVRTFIGDPDADLDGTFDDGLHGLQEVWVMQHHDESGQTGRYSVSRVTGEITEATMPMNTTLNAPINPVTEAEAQRIAEEFARARVPDFNSFTRQESHGSAIAPGADGEDVLHRAEWRQESSVSGAWLPGSIIVEVNLDTGLIYHFFMRIETYDGPTEPVVREEQAIEAALTAAEEVGMSSLSVAGVQLKVIPSQTGAVDDPGGVQRELLLVWEVQINNVWRGMSGLINVTVDAMTGEVEPFP